MTRKDYQLIATALKDALGAVDHPQRVGAVLAAQELAYRLRDDNPRFDRKKFLEACGLDLA
jgi:hypothetical protein